MIDTESIRKKVLDLAMLGHLTDRLDSDDSVETLFTAIQKEKNDQIKKGLLRKSKAFPKIDADKIPGTFPKEWYICYIDDVAFVTKLAGFEYTKYIADNIQNEGIPLFKGKNVQHGNLIMEFESFIPKNVSDELPRSQLKKKCLLTPYVGTIGNIAIFNGEFEAHLGSNVGKIEILNSIDKTYLLEEYVLYYLRSSFGYSELTKHKKATAQDSISIEAIRNVILPIPSVKEQQKIVNVIKEIFEQLDIIDFFQAQYASNIEILKSKLIDAGICGKLTEQLPEDGDAEDLYNQIQDEKAKLIKEGKIKKEKPLPEITKGEIPFNIPKNWKWVRLGDISAKISSGNTPAGGKNSNAYVENGYCFFREQNIYDDGIHEEGLVYITEELLKTRGNSTVLPMDILLNITGGSIGRCALVPDNFTKGSINQHILIIRMIDSRLRFYVHKYICSPYVQKYIKGNVVGDKDGFSGGRCKNLLIPLPPISEQKRIVDKLETLLGQL